MLNDLDGTTFTATKRLSETRALRIRFGWNEKRRRHVNLFLQKNESHWLNKVLDLTTKHIDGFESPSGMELLAKIDWLIDRKARGRPWRPFAAACESGQRDRLPPNGSSVC